MTDVNMGDDGAFGVNCELLGHEGAVRLLSTPSRIVCSSIAIY